MVQAHLCLDDYSRIRNKDRRRAFRKLRENNIYLQNYSLYCHVIDIVNGLEGSIFTW